MKILMALSITLLLSGCTTAPVDPNRAVKSEVESIFSKFNNEVRAVNKSKPFNFKYMFAVIPPTRLGDTIAGCSILPPVSKFEHTPWWKSLSEQEQSDLIESQNKPFVFINPVEWNKINHAQREIVIFHELGHCYLNKVHDTAKVCARKKNSLMCEQLSQINAEAYVKNPRPFLKDLFQK